MNDKPEEKTVAEKEHEQFEVAISVIEYAQENPEKGRMECPSCGKDIVYNVAKCNNHVWAKCETEGCIAFMM